MHFQYGDKKTEYLKKKDKVFGEIIERIGHIKREVDSDLFSSVIHHIIGLLQGGVVPDMRDYAPKNSKRRQQKNGLQ